MNIRVIVLAGLALLLTGCTSWRWSGHPAGFAVSTGVPGRVSQEGRRQDRPHGLALHSGEEDGAERSPLYNIPDRPGPHTVNALLYAQRGDQYRQEAAAHRTMKQLYDGDAEMTAHCDKLIKQLTALADEYQAISKLQEQKAEAYNEPLLEELRK